MSKDHQVNGFTLIEVLLVAVLVGIVGLAIVATFDGGLKIFNRAESSISSKTDVLLAVEKMEKDLRNTFSFKGIDFVGTAQKVTFPAMLRTTFDKNRTEESPGSVSYYLDDATDGRFFSREEKTYTQAFKKESSEHGDIAVLAPVKNISFQYFSYDPQAETYRWVDLWDKSKEKEKQKEGRKDPEGGIALEDRIEDIPLGVKIRVNYADGGKILTLNRTVFIKTAVSLNLAQRRAGSKKKDLQETQSEL